LNTKLRIAFIIFVSVFSASCTIPIIFNKVGDIEPSPTSDTLVIYKENLIESFQDDLSRMESATRYQIDLQIAEDITSVVGNQTVIYTNNEGEPLSEIYFRMFPNAGGDYMTVSNVKVDGMDAETEMQYQNTALRVRLPKAILPGESVKFSMDFSQHVPDVMSGNYGLYVFMDGILALDNFFPIIPVYNQEGWNVEDPPANADMIFTDVAFFDVHVRAPEKLVLVSSGVETESTIKENIKQTRFVGGPQRDFYLAASERFISSTSQINGTLVTSYYPPEFEEMGEMVLDTAVKALGIYSRRFGTYPYSEYDLVSTPMLAGGMEYSGAAALSLRFYDSQATYNGFPGKIFLESATAHEVAHQWFFNLVMNDQPDEPWLDEGFAQYLTVIYYRDAYSVEAGIAFTDSLQQRWNRVNGENIPVSLPADLYSPEEYGAIIYGRAPLFLLEMEEKMGKEDFAVFLREYVEDFSWEIVNTPQFKEMAGEQCHCDLDLLFSEWWKPE